jgi:hypothetical protein
MAFVLGYLPVAAGVRSKVGFVPGFLVVPVLRTRGVWVRFPDSVMPRPPGSRPACVILKAAKIHRQHTPPTNHGRAARLERTARNIFWPKPTWRWRQSRKKESRGGIFHQRRAAQRGVKGAAHSERFAQRLRLQTNAAAPTLFSVCFTYCVLRTRRACSLILRRDSAHASAS